MPRASKNKPSSAVLDPQSSFMAAAEGVFGSGTNSKDGHVSENSDASPISVDTTYMRAFGTGEGLCSCARCLRKSAPFTSDYREAVNDVARCLASVESEAHADSLEQLIKQGSTTPQSTSTEEGCQDLAEAICQAAIEQADPNQLYNLLSDRVEDEGVAADIADILALLVAQRGHANIVPVLADHGAGFERVDRHRGGPPLMHAANNGHASTVAALLEGNADVDAVDNMGQTPLMVAVFSDRAQAAEVLIKEGTADLEAEDKSGRTAVSHAAKYGSVDCLNLLGNSHADVYHKDFEGKTPPQIAESASRLDAVAALKKWQQLQNLRMRCEKRKQKDATQQQAELTAEQIAERKAKADAFAEALIAEDAAEKEKGQIQKAKAKKAKVKGKGKAVSAAAVATDLSAAADVVSKSTVSPATVSQPPSDQAHQVTGQSNTESPDTVQPSAAPQASTMKSPEGPSTVQPSLSAPLSKESSSVEASDEDHLPSRPQLPVQDVSPPQTASQIPVHNPPQAHYRSSVPSSSGSSPMQSPRPRSAASEADSVQDPSSLSVASRHSTRDQSPSLNRSSQSPSGQQAFSQHLRAALSPAAKPPMQSQAVHSNGPVSSPSDAAAAAQSAPPSRPGSANAALAPMMLGIDMIAAMSRPSSASPASKSGHASPQQSASSAAGSRPGSAGSQPQHDGHVTAVPVSGSATPAGSAAASLPESPCSTAAASPAEQTVEDMKSADAEPSTSASADAAQEDSPTAIKAVSSGMQSPVSPQDDAAVPTSPPVTTPVRKPPGLPSPVPHLQGQDSGDLSDSVISSDRWPDQVSSKSETASNPCSPTKAKASQPAQPAEPVSLSGASLSGALSEAMSEEGSQASQTTSNSQPLDTSAAAVAERLAREQKQQQVQEAKHLAAKLRRDAAKRDAIAAQDKRQQDEHAARAASKARARAAKAEKEALGRPISGPFQGPATNRPPHRGDPRGEDREYRGPRDLEEAPVQAPKSYPAQGVRHVPAHPAPQPGPERHSGPGRSTVYSGPGSEYEHSPGPGSDYGGSEYDMEHAAMRGRGAARGGGRGGRGRGGRGVPPQESMGGRGRGGRHAPQPEPIRESPAVDPLTFVGVGGSTARPTADRANPDPLAFGTTVSGPKQQLNGLLVQLPAIREDPDQETGLQYLLKEIRRVVSAAAKQHIPLPADGEAAIQELTKTLGARAQLMAAISARPVNALALELACEAGRECKLLYKGTLMQADRKLTQIKARQNPEPKPYHEPGGQHLDPRQLTEPRQGHPDARRPADPRHRVDARQCPNEPRGRPDPHARQHADPRQYSYPRQYTEARRNGEARQHPENRQHVEPRQQQYVPQQPQSQYEPHRHHGPLTEARNGRHIPQEFAEAPGVKHQPRGHAANPANPPRTGKGARNPGAIAAAAAANAAINPGYNPDRAPASAVPAVNNIAAQRSHKPAVKEAAGQESDECVVCWAHEKDVVCIPCGHVAMCKSCSKAVMQQSGLCPVCRQKVREIIQLFKV